MNTFAILRDAGFVKTRLGSADNPTTAEDIRALVQRICKHPTLAGQSLYRVYFYDAPPFAKTKLVRRESMSVSLLGAYLLPLRPIRYILILVKEPLHLEQGDSFCNFMGQITPTQSSPAVYR